MIWICSLISFESLSTHESNSQRSVILFILSLSPALKRLEEHLAVARVRGKPRRIYRKQRGKHRRPFAMPRKIVGPRLRATALRSEAEDLMTSRRRHHATSDLLLNYPWWCFMRVLNALLTVSDCWKVKATSPPLSLRCSFVHARFFSVACDGVERSWPSIVSRKSTQPKRHLFLSWDGIICGVRKYSYITKFRNGSIHKKSWLEIRRRTKLQHFPLSPM